VRIGELGTALVREIAVHSSRPQLTLAALSFGIAGCAVVALWALAQL
jgi:hypothetical protein